jgi:hypothetical protein
MGERVGGKGERVGDLRGVLVGAYVVEFVGIAWGAAVGKYMVFGAPPGAVVLWRNSFGLFLKSVTMLVTALANMAARISFGLPLPF